MRAGKWEITPGFLLLAAWLNYADTQGIFRLAALCCALHELGHVGMLRLLGAEIRRVRLTAVGAEIELALGLSWGGELAAALSGPLVNLLAAAVSCRLEGGAVFAGINLVLGCFNLLPIGGLDGGRALAALLSMGPDPAFGLDALRLISAWVCAAILLAGVYVLLRWRNVTLALVGAWLLLTGGGERAHTSVFARNKACYSGGNRVK